MGRSSERWSRSASPGLIAVEVVGESPPSTPRQTIEIECPGGPVLRLREDVSAEVLQRVMRACLQMQIENSPANGPVRSC